MTKLDKFVISQSGALSTLLDEGYATPYFMVLYATIDILGFVTAEDERTPPGVRFRSFVNRYMSRHLQDVNAHDLWGARCALLHTGTPESDASRRNEARQILYSWGTADNSLSKRVIAESQTPDRYVAVNAEDLHAWMIDGLEDLAKELQSNTVLNERCITRVARFYCDVPVPG